MKRGEEPADAVRREICEELDVEVDVDDAPMVVVDARHRRVDVVFKGRLAGDDPDPPPPAPASPEIVEVRWFPPNHLPILLPEATTALVELARASRPAPESG